MEIYHVDIFVQARRTALQKLLTKDKHCLSEIEISKIAWSVWTMRHNNILHDVYFYSSTFGYSFRDIANLARQAAHIGITKGIL